MCGGFIGSAAGGGVGGMLLLSLLIYLCAVGYNGGVVAVIVFVVCEIHQCWQW